MKTNIINPDELWNSDRYLEDMSEEELTALIEGCEFEIHKNKKGKYQVNDLQCGNLGGIEEEEFDTILDIAIRMADTYFNDYYGLHD